MNRRLHLSKTKHLKLNESGQLIIFYLISLIWSIQCIIKDGLFNNGLSNGLWFGYPHSTMSYLYKMFWIIQLSYWIHTFPELYFQKVINHSVNHFNH